MKERIDEHDMTKKMMSILRGGYKLIKEEESNKEEPQKALASPYEGSTSILPLDESYFEMDSQDNRFKSFQTKLSGVVPQATVTSIFINEDGGFVANGYALRYDNNSVLFFRMALSEDSINVTSENVQGKIGAQVQMDLQKFLDNLRADAKK